MWGRKANCEGVWMMRESQNLEEVGSKKNYFLQTEELIVLSIQFWSWFFLQTCQLIFTPTLPSSPDQGQTKILQCHTNYTNCPNPKESSQLVTYELKFPWDQGWTIWITTSRRMQLIFWLHWTQPSRMKWAGRAGRANRGQKNSSEREEMEHVKNAGTCQREQMRLFSH